MARARRTAFARSQLRRAPGSLLAHASVLLGDLGQDPNARAYGNAALLGMQEAEASQAKSSHRQNAANNAASASLVIGSQVQNGR